MKTTAEKLAQVEAAIQKAEQMQSYSVNGMSVGRASLSELYRERARLESRLAAEESADGGRMAGQSRLQYDPPTSDDE